MSRSKKCLPIILIVILMCVNLGQAQLITKPYEILLKSGNLELQENFSRITIETSITSEELVNQRFYRLVQFTDIPTAQKHEQLNQLGIQLLDYIPNKAYLSSFPMSITQSQLNGLGIRAIYKIPVAWKQSVEVASQSFDSWSLNRDDVLLNLNYYDNLDSEYVQTQLKKLGVRLIKTPDYINLIQLAISKNKIQELCALPFVSYVSQFTDPGAPEDDLGRALHRNNVLDSAYPTGRHYDGSGVAIMVRDDGAVGPHIDFKGRLVQEPGFGGTHGDGVAGIAGGAGNLNPRFKGAAKGSQVYVLDYEADFLDETLDLHLSDNVVLTNSSYSNGCNAGYTVITETVDRQTHENPTLLHIFSAGNSNNLDCDYGAGNQWANITGGHKQGKNVIATANLNSDGTLVNSSSRGPAHDGRIKPDIAANGAAHMSTDPDNEYQSFGGTSGAAPAIMGSAAQLYQAYRELNGGVDPESSLIKATLLNTANDLGNPGPDFRFGWGHVNSFKAVQLLEEQRYLDGNIDQGMDNDHTISVPAGTKQLKIMLYWLDKEAEAMTTKSLVNDLNLQVTNPAGTVLMPWILDPTPDPAILNLPATTGVDNLNNMEQVLVNDPPAGDYNVNVAGFEIPLGAVKYYVVYEQIAADDISVIYPNGGEGFVSSETERIHWDAIGDNDDFLLESSIDGIQWDPIATVQGSMRMYDWNVPNVILGTAEIRVTRGGVSDKSDAQFSIGPVPGNLEVLEACPDYIKLEWDAAPGATSYEVFLLGDKYMEVVGATTDVTIDLPIANPFDENWFAVRALGPDNYVGRRTIAIPHNLGYFNCTVDHDLGLIEILKPSGDKLFGCGTLEQEVSVIVRNHGQEPVTTFEAFYQLDNEPVVMETFTGSISPLTNEVFTFTTPFQLASSGAYDLTIWTDLDLDLALFNDTLSNSLEVEVITQALTLTILEDFEQETFPPTNWLTNNEDGLFGWERAETTGSDGNATFAGFLDHYNYNASGEIDEFFSFPIDLTNQTSAVITFDMAYTHFSPTLFDSLRVDVFTNCGNDYVTTLYGASGVELATTPLSTTFFNPDADEWRNVSGDLSPFAGEEIVVKFITINGYGNSLYLDNINLFSSSEAPVADFVMDATGCVDQNILISDASTGFGNTLEWDFGPDASIATATGAGPHNVSFSSTGSKDVKLIAINANGTSEITQQIEIEERAIAAYTSDINQATVSFTNTSLFADSYVWDFGDGNNSIETSPVHVYASTGVYLVQLTASSNNCGDENFSETVTIEVLDVNDLENQFELNILPNPNQGDFGIRISDAQNLDLKLDLIDMTGKQIKKWDVNAGGDDTLIPVNGLQLDTGVYLLRATNDKSTKTLRFVVQ